LRPLYPELLGLMAEAGGNARNFTAMVEALGTAEAMLDAIARDAMAPLSLASMYHKLALVYLKVSTDIIPVAENSKLN
jgi:hypothetical protein